MEEEVGSGQVLVSWTTLPVLPFWREKGKKRNQDPVQRKFQRTSKLSTFDFLTAPTVNERDPPLEGGNETSGGYFSATFNYNPFDLNREVEMDFRSLLVEWNDDVEEKGRLAMRRWREGKGWQRGKRRKRKGEGTRRRELFCSNFRASCAEKFEAKEKKGGKRKGERGKSVSARRSFPRAERHN